MGQDLNADGSSFFKIKRDASKQEQSTDNNAQAGGKQTAFERHDPNNETAGFFEMKCDGHNPMNTNPRDNCLGEESTNSAPFYETSPAEDGRFTPARRRVEWPWKEASFRGRLPGSMGAVRHRFTVEEYRKMGEAGIFHEDDRMELIGGEIIEMAAIGARHFEGVYRLNRLFSRWVFFDASSHYGVVEVERLGVSVQNPLALAIDGEPQPDLVVLQRRGGSSSIPTPEEALLVVEVADTSLAYDRNIKFPRYAEAGIPEAWLVELNAGAIEVHSEPGPAGYGKVAHVRRGERIASATLPNLDFDAAEALPPEG